MRKILGNLGILMIVAALFFLWGCSGGTQGPQSSGPQVTGYVEIGLDGQPADARGGSRK